MTDRKPDQPEPAWRVTLTPHRSLTREGFVALMVILVAMNFAGGVLFLVAGAWPITGFMGLDVLLVWWAFRHNFADGQRAEQISISGDVVRLQRLSPQGTVDEMTFNRRWVRVDLEVDTGRELVGKLSLSSHGKETEIASFLGAEERLSLAQALRQALASPKI